MLLQNIGIERVSHMQSLFVAVCVSVHVLENYKPYLLTYPFELNIDVSDRDYHYLARTR